MSVTYKADNHGHLVTQERDREDRKRQDERFTGRGFRGEIAIPDSQSRLDREIDTVRIVPALLVFDLAEHESLDPNDGQEGCDGQHEFPALESDFRRERIGFPSSSKYKVEGEGERDDCRKDNRDDGTPEASGEFVSGAIARENPKEDEVDGCDGGFAEPKGK